MRKACTMIPALLLGLPVCVMSHGDERTLGHHWAVPDYVNEIHVQIALMAGLALLGAIVLRVVRVVDKRRAGIR